jgi:hypothetical protein
MTIVWKSMACAALLLATREANMAPSSIAPVAPSLASVLSKGRVIMTVCHLSLELVDG